MCTGAERPPLLLAESTRCGVPLVLLTAGLLHTPHAAPLSSRVPTQLPPLLAAASGEPVAGAGVTLDASVEDVPVEDVPDESVDVGGEADAASSAVSTPQPATALSAAIAVAARTRRCAPSRCLIVARRASLLIDRQSPLHLTSVWASPARFLCGARRAVTQVTRRVLAGCLQ